MSTKEQEWSKKKLQACVKEKITQMFEGVLDLAEVAVGEDNRYKVLRSKILRIGNDAIRGINSEIDSSYEVEYRNFGKDEVQVRQRRG